VGTTTLTYSFVGAKSIFSYWYSETDEYQHAYLLTAAQKTAITGALGAWSAVANIKFKPVVDTWNNVGDLRFGGYEGMSDDTAAWAYFPAAGPAAGDVWIGRASNELKPGPGSYDYMTFMHEIGHALGLKHPFSGIEGNASVLAPELDDVRYTLMSYNNGYSVQPSTPMVLDILVMQGLYGANTKWHAGNDTYSWKPDQVVFQTLWDAGGIDTLDASNQREGVLLNLNEGEFSSIGAAFIDYVQGALTNTGLAIAFGAKIENATGSAFNDILIGNALNNVLNGRAGQDTLIGGLGNDTYIVDDEGDVVVETSAFAYEIDTVQASVSYTLAENLEVLTLTGRGNINGTGNALTNRISGNVGNNVLDGGAGADTLIGGAGNDTYIVDDAADVIIETGTVRDIDTVMASVSWVLGANLEKLILTGSNDLDGTGNAQANEIVGNAGNNVLNGGRGADRMVGGLGEDTYYVDNLRDVVVEYAGEGERDNVYASISYALGEHVENGELLGKANLNLTGNASDNVLIGNAGANILKGMGGKDILRGGLGNDTYHVDSSDDTIIEEGLSPKEIDSVFASVSWKLGDNLENLALTGTGKIDGLGNALNNRITGNVGDNILDGGEGIDILIGGLGNDTYVVDNVRDVIIETSRLLGEIDTVRASVNWTLGVNLEHLELTGSSDLNGTGNALGNHITGNAGNNVLNGGAGNDALDGAAGDDVLIGGLGSDTLTGGSGADRFVFNLVKDIGLGDKRDAITDFNGAEGDRIDFGKIDANLLLKGLNTFTFIGDGAFTGAGQLRFDKEILSGNINGNLAADFEIHLVGVSNDQFNGNYLA